MTERLSRAEFEFVPEYADCLAHAASSWATLEYYVNSSIWTLAGTSAAQGACLTSQIVSLHGKLSALLALMKLREVNQELITKVNKFSESVRDAQEWRNRIIHDVWLNVHQRGERSKDEMGRLLITAARQVQFRVEPVPLATIREGVELIHLRRRQFAEIREAINAALKSLPEIPHAKLNPITENPYLQRTPPSETQ
jgi:hypothetical protein